METALPAKAERQASSPRPLHPLWIVEFAHVLAGKTGFPFFRDVRQTSKSPGQNPGFAPSRWKLQGRKRER
jgi:hypothetical protein